MGDDHAQSRRAIALYRQQADFLTARIRGGGHAPGERTPSEHQLAATSEVGRPASRQAMQLLVRKRGSGTFVWESRQEVDLFSRDGARKKGVAS
jgi:DNA-binding GntR family transcriptional regulator